MTHDIVFGYFRKCIPQLSKPSKVEQWFPNGKNSIRVRFEGGSEYIFTYYGDDCWCFETVEYFIRRLKGV